MKIMLISDLQAHNWPSYPETDQHGVNLRLLDTVRELKRLHDLSLKNGVKMLIILGDIFEARSALAVPVLNAVYESLYGFHESGMHVVLLLGNHDRCSVGGEHSLKVFKSFCTVIDKPTNLPVDGANIVGIPFHPSTKTLQKAIKRYVRKDTNLLLMHCAIKSTRLPGGKIWGEGISLEDIPTNVTCLLGHYHRWTELRPGKVWYLGSMTHVDFGDASIDKFYCVFNTETKSVQFHHTKGPRFITLELSLRDGTLYDRNALTPSMLDIEKYMGVIPGNFLKVKSLPRGFTDTHGLQVVLHSLGARHVSFDVESLLQSTQLPPETLESSDDWQQQTVTDMLDQYVESTPHNLDQVRLVETAMQIVEDVQSLSNNSLPKEDPSDPLDILDLEQG